MAMVFFLAQDGETKVALDSEASVQVSLSSTVSKSSTMSGGSTSDDVIEGNAVISTSGQVTYAKLTSQKKNLNPIEYQEAIQEARRNRRRFTVYIKDYGMPLLQDYEDCVISDCSFTIDKYSDTITVSITFEQVFVTEAAKKAFLAPKPKESAKPTVTSPTSTGQSTKTDAGATIGKSIEEGTRTLFSPATPAPQEVPNGTTN